MEIFQKYKCVGLEKHKLTLQKMTVPLIVIGQKNVGKKELIKFSLKSVIFCNVNQIPEYSNGFFYNTICISKVDDLPQTEQKALCSYIDKYQSYVRFIFTSRTNRIIDSLSSRICYYKLLPPSDDDIKYYISKILNNEKIYIDVNSFFGKTYHLILIELTLFKHGKSDDILYTDLNQCKHMLDNLDILSYSDVRKQLYELYLRQTNMHEIINDLTEYLIVQNKYDCDTCSSIIQKASHYEHQMCIGNKEIYHLEAFVFVLKNRILYNIK